MRYKYEPEIKEMKDRGWSIGEKAERKGEIGTGLEKRERVREIRLKRGERTED
uniref:Uncharacterized protein n=1 Tax=Octopus bimaculoides TaxID=37653 RepID=A0A0L8GQA3_OCTBM